MLPSDWVTSDEIAGWVHYATKTLLSTVSDFAEDDPRWLGPYVSTVNPSIWS